MDPFLLYCDIHFWFFKSTFTSFCFPLSFASSYDEKGKLDEVTTVGVINTKKWLDKYFDDPIKICSAFDQERSKEVYKYLQLFGMYQPSSLNRGIYKELVEAKAWQKILQLFKKYQKKWKGPNPSIYIFPIDGRNGKLLKTTGGKSGVTFKDKIFLFLSKPKKEKDWEALFVHEYHHCTRMNQLNKKEDDYNLLDSLVFEGLAEHAVLEYCGEKYLASWCNRYKENILKIYWDRKIKHYLDLPMSDSVHDDIMYGRKFYPEMLGYALGFQIISHFKKKGTFSITQSFSMDSTEFLKDDFFKEQKPKK